MIKFWFEFEQTILDNPPVGTLLGVGITSPSKSEAIQKLEEKVFKNGLPKYTV